MRPTRTGALTTRKWRHRDDRSSRTRLLDSLLPSCHWLLHLGYRGRHRPEAQTAEGVPRKASRKGEPLMSSAPPGIRVTRETRKCPHGHTLGENRLPPGAYNAPISQCRCCFTHFMYSDSGSYTTSRQETVANDPNLCPQCGGRARHTIIEDGRVTSPIGLSRRSGVLMPRRFPHMLDLLWGQRKADDERAREAIRHALEVRQERAVRLKLSEGRNRTGGWNA